jgi:four helix bundle protein
MKDPVHAKSFRDLLVYQKSKKVADMVFEVSKTFPKEEMYSLTGQFRRASRSIGGQIAEAWGKRRYERHFISKLTDADSEQLETQHWVDTAVSCGYLTEGQAGNILAELEEIGRMLNSMMAKAKTFCRN